MSRAKKNFAKKFERIAFHAMQQERTGLASVLLKMSNEIEVFSSSEESECNKRFSGVDASRSMEGQLM